MKAAELIAQIQAAIKAGQGKVSFSPKAYDPNFSDEWEDRVGLSLEIQKSSLKDDYVNVGAVILSGEASLLGLTTQKISVYFHVEDDEAELWYAKVELSQLKLQSLAEQKWLPAATWLADIGAFAFLDVEMIYNFGTGEVRFFAETSRNSLTFLDQKILNLDYVGFEWYRSFPERNAKMRLLADLSLAKKKCTVAIELPVGEGEWNLSLVAQDKQPFTFADIYSLLPGAPFKDALGALPGPLARIMDSGLLQFSCAFSPKKTQIRAIKAQVAAPANWEIAKDWLTLQSLTIDVGIDLRGTKPVLSMEVAGDMQISSLLQLSLLAQASTQPTEDWLFAMSGELDLRRASQIAKLLPGGLAEWKLPEDFINLRSIELRRLELQLNPFKGTLTDLQLYVKANASLTLFKGFTLANPHVVLAVTNPLGQQGLPPRSLEGEIKATLQLFGCEFMLAAAKQEDGWLFSAETSPGNRFTVRNLAKGIGDLLQVKELGALPASVPDVQLFDIALSYGTARSEVKFKAASETTFTVPFLAQPLEIQTWFELSGQSTQEGYQVLWMFVGSIQIGKAKVSLQMDFRQPQPLFRGMWMATQDEGLLSLETLCKALGMDLDFSQIPAAFQPTLRMLALEYDHGAKRLSFGAVSGSGASFFLVAERPEERWEFMFGIDYRVGTDLAAASDENPYLEKAVAIGLTQFTAVYASKDYPDFKLPRIPQVVSAQPGQEWRDKVLQIKKGFMLLAEVKELSLPSIGEWQVDINRLYVSVYKAAQIDAKLQGQFQVSLPNDPQGLLLKVDAAYEGKDKALELQLEFKSEGLLSLPVLVKPWLPQGYTLQPDISYGEISSGSITLKSKEKSFSAKLYSTGKSLVIPGFASLSLSSFTFNYSPKETFLETKGDLSLPFLAELLQQEQVNLGGTLKFELNSGSGKISFLPDDFRLALPTIPYQEVVQVSQSPGQQPVQVTRQRELKIGAQLQELVIGKDGGWYASAKGGLSFTGLPELVQALMPDGTRVLEGRISAGGSYVQVEGEIARLIIPDMLKAIQTPGSKPEWPPLGDSYIGMQRLRFDLGKSIKASVRFGIGLPSELNSFLGLKGLDLFRTYQPGNAESLLQVELAVGTDGFEGGIIGSPFKPVRGISDEGADAWVVDLDEMFQEKGLGRIRVKKPKANYSLKTGAFKLSIGYEIDQERGLALPLSPFKRVLEMIGLAEAAKALPKAMPVKTQELSFGQFLKDLEALGVPLDDKLKSLLQTLAGLENKLPPRFRSYLKINIPQAMSLDLDITADGGVSLAFESKGDPLQLLLPTPTAIIGMRLSKLGFGTMLGGSLLKLNLSAELDLFDPFTLGAALMLPDSGELTRLLPERSKLQRTISIKDLLLVIVYQTTIPIPIPLFYEEFRITSTGIEGFEQDFAISFPQPKLNVMKALQMVGELYTSFKENKDLTVEYPISLKRKEEGNSEMNIIFSAGPAYFRLPKYLSPQGQQITLGITERMELLNVLNLLGITINGLRRRSPAYFIQAVLLKDRVGKWDITLFENLKIGFNWVISTPQEFMDLPAGMLPGYSKERAGDLLKVLPSRQSTTPAPEEGVAMMALGSIEIKDWFKVETVMALGIQRDTVGTGFRFQAAFGQNLVGLNLLGLVLIKPKEGQLLLKGAAGLQVLGLPVLQGEFELANDRLWVYSKTDMRHLGLPILVEGELRGSWRPGFFEVEGKNKLQLWDFAAEGRFYLLATETRAASELKLESSLGSIGSFSLLATSDSGRGHLLMGLSLTVQLLRVLELRMAGDLKAVNNKLEANAEGSLSILGTKIIDIRANLNENGITSTGRVNLFPGVAWLTFDLDYTLRQTGKLFSFGGSGRFVVGAFSLNASLDILSSEAESRFQLTLLDFLGSRFRFSFRSLNAGQLRMEVDQSSAVRLWNDAVVISRAPGSGEGPTGYIQWSSASLYGLELIGSIRVLGVYLSGELQYINRVMNFNLRAGIPGDPYLQAEYQFQGTISPDSLQYNTSITFNLKVGRILRDAVKAATWGIIDLPLPDMDSGFSFNGLSLSADRLGGPPSGPSREILDAIDRVQERIVELNRQIDDTKEEVIHVDQALVREGVAVEAELRKLPAGSTLRAGLEKQLDQINRHRSSFGNPRIALSRAREVRSSIQDRVNAVRQQQAALIAQRDGFRDICNTLIRCSLDWKNYWDDHGNDGDYKVRYEQEIRPRLLNYMRSEMPSANISDPTWLHGEIQHNAYWTHHGRSRRDEIRQDHYSAYVRYVGEAEQTLNNWIQSLNGGLESAKQALEVSFAEEARCLAALKEVLQVAKAFILVKRAEEKYKLQYQAIFPPPKPQDEGLAGQPNAGYRVRIRGGLSIQLIGLPPLNLPVTDWFDADIAAQSYDTPLISRIPEITQQFIQKNLWSILLGHYTTGAIIDWLRRVLQGQYNHNGMDFMSDRALVQDFAQAPLSPSEMELAEHLIAGLAGVSADKGALLRKAILTE